MPRGGRNVSRHGVNVLGGSLMECDQKQGNSSVFADRLELTRIGLTRRHGQPRNHAQRGIALDQWNLREAGLHMLADLR